MSDEELSALYDAGELTPDEFYAHKEQLEAIFVKRGIIREDEALMLVRKPLPKLRAPEVWGHNRNEPPSTDPLAIRINETINEIIRQENERQKQESEGEEE